MERVAFDPRVPLPIGTLVELGGIPYRIEGLVVPSGGSALLYEAVSQDPSPIPCVLKELYPFRDCVRQNWEIVPVEGNELHVLKERLRTWEVPGSREAYRKNFQAVPIRGFFEAAELTLPDGRRQHVENHYALMDSLTAQGQSLADYAARRREKSEGWLQDAVSIMVSVLQGYEGLHHEGLLHGDCSIGNVFLLGDLANSVGTAHILDFGCARRLRDDDPPGPLYATGGYCAPEMLYGDAPLTLAADVWGLGYLFRYLLTGEEFSTTFLMVHRRARTISRSPCGPSALNLLNSILCNALAPDRENRYQTAGTMLEDVMLLQRLLRHDPAGPVNRWQLWQGAEQFRERDPGLFLTRHIPTLVEALPPGADSLTVYAKEEGQERRPAAELLEALRGQDLYLHAPGGGGKSFAVSGLFCGFLTDPRSPLVPLYLDLAHFDGESTFSAMLARQYLDRRDEKAAQEIEALLSAEASAPRYLLILDNFHKVPDHARSRAEAAIKTAHGWKGVWVIVTGREAKGPLDHRLSLSPVPMAVIRSMVCAAAGRELSEFEDSKLCRQRETLSLPLFLMRYLEMVARDPAALPMGSALLLKSYFEEREYSASQEKAVHDILTKHLPYAAYQSMISPQKPLAEILQESYGRLRYTDGVLDEFTRTVAGPLGIMTWSSDGTLRFVHDCYQDYFASVYIAEHLLKALEEERVDPLKTIDHQWSSCAFWYQLLAMQLWGNDEEDSIVRVTSLLYDLVIRFPDTDASMLTSNILNTVHASICLDRPWAHLLPGATDEENLFMMNFCGVSFTNEEIHINRELARGGSPISQLILARTYIEQEQCMEKDLQQSIYWAELAARQDDAEACLFLADLHFQHTGTPEKAIPWLERAAGLGDADAAFRLGEAFWLGRGAQRDVGKALAYFRQAEGTYILPPRSKLFLSHIGWIFPVRQADPYDRPMPEREHFRSLKERADPARCLELLTMMQIVYHSDLCQRHQFNCDLGSMYFHGKGLDGPNYEKAYEHYSAAAEAGHPIAMYRLGLLLEQGLGCAQDREKGRMYREQAEAMLTP